MPVATRSAGPESTKPLYPEEPQAQVLSKATRFYRARTGFRHALLISGGIPPLSTAPLFVFVEIHNSASTGTNDYSIFYFSALR